MAVNNVDIAGDSSNIFLRLQNLSGVNSLDFIGGSFIGSSEEKRICPIFLGIGNKTMKMRLEFIDPVFTQLSFTGKPLYRAEGEHN